MKYSFNIKGTSGKLSCIVIGDYLTHKDLKELEFERVQHADALSKLKFKIVQIQNGKLSDSEKKTQIALVEQEIEKLRLDYVPTDFDAYTIRDKSQANLVEKVACDKELRDKPIDDEEKIWRISSLTASVDDDTRILVLPIAESKRETKIADTTY